MHSASVKTVTPAAAAPFPCNIPARAHLVWFGASFPWVHLLALRSAAQRGGFSEVVLHHDTDLSGSPHYAELVAEPRVRLQRLDPMALFQRCAPYAEGLCELLGRLRTPQTRSDLVRFALLYAEGGVYLDMDTITLSAFGSLLGGASVVLGLERIVYPAQVLESRAPLVRLTALGRSQLRDVLRRCPEGWRLFRRVEQWYPLAPNPAVMAGHAGARFLAQTLAEMLRIPKDQQPLPYAIGPHLLQRMLRRYTGTDLRLCQPQVFYPFAPEISEHWFRLGREVDAQQAVSRETRVVHWYASVRTKSLIPRIDPEYVRAHAGRQLFSTLALPFLASAGTH